MSGFGYFISALLGQQDARKKGRELFLVLSRRCCRMLLPGGSSRAALARNNLGMVDLKCLLDAR